MYRLLESISLKDGVLENIEYHQRRLERSRAHFGYVGTFDWAPVYALAVLHPLGWFKIRFEYAQQIEELTCTPYLPKAIKTLKIIHADQIDYSFKYADRTKLNDLYSQRGEADDVLICRNGLVTDTSYCNVAFLRCDIWITPRTPLLAGTKREQLLAKGVLIEEDIDLGKLACFSQIAFINAFLDIEAVDLILVPAVE